MTPSNALKTGAILITVIAAAGLAWLSMSAAIAAAGLRNLPNWLSTLSSPDLYADMAERALTAKQPSQALPWAIEAVHAAPLSARGLRLLGQAEGKLGRYQQYNDLMALAAAAGWRDAPTQAWALRRAITTNDMTSAVERGEALVLNDQARTEVLTAFRLLATIPEARRKLVDRLALRPDWRPWYFELRGQLTSEQLAGVAAVLADLRKTTARATPSEARATLAALVNSGKFDTAWALYQHLFGVRATGQPLVDSGFGRDDADYKPGGNATIFDWTLLDQAGGEVAIARQGEFAGNPALAVTVDTTNEIVLAEQVATLSPGSYTLGYRARAEDTDADPRARWQVYCVKDAGVLAPEQTRALTTDWSFQTIRFTVPAQCPGIRVRLLGKRGEKPASYWFDDIMIKHTP